MDPFKFRIPDGTEILAGHYRVFDEDDFNADPSSPESFLFSSLGEEVYLYSADSEGNLTGYGHGFRFGPTESDETLGRWVISTGEEHFVAQAEATLNSDNAGPKVGPVVINEIMYNPLSGGTTINTKYEYLELRNISSEIVTLFDPEVIDNAWRIEGSVTLSFPTEVTLLPDEYIVLISFNPEADIKATTLFRYTYSMDESVRLFGPYDGTLSNSGGEIALLKPGDPVLPPDPNVGFVPYVLVDQVDYADAAPWPTGANGTGDSLQRILSSEYGNDPINWQVASPTAGRDNAGAPVEDVDGDGLPDDWERTIVDFDPGDEIGEIADVQGEDDFDGDGESNLDEWMAGTDPTDASSIMAISSITNGIDSTIVIRWHSVSNRRYSILRSTDLTAGFDQIEAANVPATPPENSYTIDTGQARNAFYRIVMDE
jgi:hypothetical protein